MKHFPIASVPPLWFLLSLIDSHFLGYRSKIVFLCFMSSIIILDTHSLLLSINLCSWSFFYTTDVNFHLLLYVSSAHIKHIQNQSNLKTLCSFCILYLIEWLLPFLWLPKEGTIFDFPFSLYINLDTQSVILLQYLLYWTPYFNNHRIHTIIIFT